MADSGNARDQNPQRVSGSAPPTPRGQAPSPIPAGEGSSGNVPVPRWSPRPRLGGAPNPGTNQPRTVAGGATGGGEGTSTGASGAGPSQPPPGDNRPPPPPPPPVPQPVVGGGYTCNLCDPPRNFNNDRALSGHMHMHRNRQWRGSFPPPVYSREEFMQDETARALLNPPLEVQEAALAAALAGEAGQGGRAAAAGRETIIRDFDLNVSLEGANEPAAAAGEGSSGAGPGSGAEGGIPDLNEPVDGEGRE